MHKVDRPIRFKIHADGSVAWQYMNYTVSKGYFEPLATAPMMWQPIYYGKAMCNADGDADIDITQIMRDYTYQESLVFNYELQNYEPRAIKRENTIQSIEKEGVNYMTTKFKIEWDVENFGGIVNFDATSMSFPAWMFNRTVFNPYEETGSRIANYSGIKPHVPYIDTNNYYIVFNFHKNTIGNNVYFTVFSDHLQGFSMRVEGRGNYTNGYTLSDFWGAMGEPISTPITRYDGGHVLTSHTNRLIGGSYTDRVGLLGAELPNQTIIPNGEILHSKEGEYAVIDTCPADYYIAWLTPWFEWQSQPIKASWITDDCNDFRIKNIHGYSEFIENRNKETFKIKTGKLSKEMYDLFISTLQAPYILLYHTKRDKAFWLKPSGSGRVMDKVNTPRIFEADFVEITEK